MRWNLFSRNGRRPSLPLDPFSSACRWPRRSRKRQECRPAVRLLVEQLENRLTPSFSLGAAADYAILFEGGGSNTLGIANSTTNTAGSGFGQGGGIGNIGVGGSPRSPAAGPPSALVRRLTSLLLRGEHP